MCRPLASSLHSNCLGCWHRQQSKAAVWWCWVHHLKLSLAKRPSAHLAWRSMKNRGQVWWLCGEGKKSKWGHFDQTSNFSSKFNFWKGPTATLFGDSSECLPAAGPFFLYHTWYNSIQTDWGNMKAWTLPQTVFFNNYIVQCAFSCILNTITFSNFIEKLWGPLASMKWW